MTSPQYSETSSVPLDSRPAKGTMATKFMTNTMVLLSSVPTAIHTPSTVPNRERGSSRGGEGGEGEGGNQRIDAGIVRGNADGHKRQQEVEPGEQGAAQLADDGEILPGGCRRGQAASLGRDGVEARQLGERRRGGRPQRRGRRAGRTGSAWRLAEQCSRPAGTPARLLARTGGSPSNAVCFPVRSRPSSAGLRDRRGCDRKPATHASIRSAIGNRNPEIGKTIQIKPGKNR